MVSMSDSVNSVNNNENVPKINVTRTDEQDDDDEHTVRLRDRLRLPLNRSLSEPGSSFLQLFSPSALNRPISSNATCSYDEPSSTLQMLDKPIKRCRLESPSDVNTRTTFSLPSTPCYSDKLRTLTALELADRIRMPNDSECQSLIIDCRPFTQFNLAHIKGATNINCANRFGRKRIQLNRTLSVLNQTKTTVVVYDENTSDLTNHSLNGILNTLASEPYKEILLLQGGMRAFQKQFPDLCDTNAFSNHHNHQNSHQQEAEISPSSPQAPPTLSSPCQSEENAIENTQATQVMPHLYLGNQKDASDLQRLRQLNIQFVLNVTSHLPGYHEGRGIRYKRLPATDSTQQNLKQYFEEAFEFIDKAVRSKSGVLVHCQAGISRSATIAIAYVMKQTKSPMFEAYKMVKTKRPIISPNLNFMGQLLEFEQSLHLQPNNNAPSTPSTGSGTLCRQGAWSTMACHHSSPATSGPTCTVKL
ncbi:hypothetical protein CHUAL_001750 [Chamberlinius hualienensis]